MPFEKTRHTTGIGRYDDFDVRRGRYDDYDVISKKYDDYDAIREATKEYYRNPEKYTRHRSYYSNRSSDYSSRSRRRHTERVNVVIEHWSGCTGERLTENIKFSLEDHYPDVKCTDFYGREHSYEVFVNGKLLYSRIMQGGYPYVDEVLDAVWRAKHGKEIYQIDRYGGSDVCNIL